MYAVIVSCCYNRLIHSNDLISVIHSAFRSVNRTRDDRNDRYYTYTYSPMRISSDFAPSCTLLISFPLPSPHTVTRSMSIDRLFNFQIAVGHFLTLTKAYHISPLKSMYFLYLFYEHSVKIRAYLSKPVRTYTINLLKIHP